MSENTAMTSIRAYIENAHNESIGGFTIPLPVTKEALQPWLDAIEADSFEEGDIAIREVRSSVPGLEGALRGLLADGIAFDELNYLAAKVSGLNNWQVDLFAAALEIERYNGNVQELINLTENINLFDLQPAFSEEQYGEFQIQMEKDNSAEIFERLEKSDDREERDFAQYILRLEAHVDVAAYGRGAVREEDGVFTDHGYLALRGDYMEKYRGREDIPPDQRIFSAPPPPMMVTDVEVPAFLAQLHAVAGNFSRDAEHNIGLLAGLRSADYLLLMGQDGAYLTEAAHAYRRGATAFDLWMNAVEKPETQAFSIHLMNVHGQIAGTIVQADVAARQQDILENSIKPIKVEATMQNGETLAYTPAAWDALDLIEKDRVQDYHRVFEDDGYRQVNHHVDTRFEDEAAACRTVPAQEFLTAVNAVYMDHARCPQPDMLRISQTAAQEMLARGDGDVYRLLPEGPEKLLPTDAVKSGLWFSEHREFAIRRENAAGLEKWAERSASAAMNRPQERGEQKKSHEPEV
ncbi:MAG: hypothetical protein LBD02_09485 [Christensenellaceae bacterium]|jgi:hypothetical protein|nr:hypothetical protein [Christensenellaceae bacterium]